MAKTLIDTSDKFGVIESLTCVYRVCLCVDGCCTMILQCMYFVVIMYHSCPRY